MKEFKEGEILAISIDSLLKEERVINFNHSYLIAVLAKEVVNEGAGISYLCTKEYGKKIILECDKIIIAIDGNIIKSTFYNNNSYMATTKHLLATKNAFCTDIVYTSGINISSMQTYLEYSYNLLWEKAGIEKLQNYLNNFNQIYSIQ